MSAFIVSKRHIDFLVTAGLELPQSWTLSWMAPHEPRPTDYARGAPWGSTAIETATTYDRELTDQTANEIGTMLLNEYRKINNQLDPVIVLKAIACYEYQSCEHSEWKTSEAFTFCRSLEAIRALPGYEEAPWGID